MKLTGGVFRWLARWCDTDPSLEGTEIRPGTPGGVAFPPAITTVVGAVAIRAVRITACGIMVLSVHFIPSESFAEKIEDSLLVAHTQSSNAAG